MAFTRAAVTAIVDDALRCDIAELLLIGTPATSVVQHIIWRGINANTAAAEVAQAANSPYLRGADRLCAQLQKRDWLLANAARLHRLRRDGDSVPRYHQLDGEIFFADFYCANRPVLVTGLVDKWPARQNWSFEGLARDFGSIDVDVQWRRDGNPLYEIQADAHVARQNFGAIIRRILDDGPSNDFYVTAFNSGHNKQALAALWHDIGTIPGWLTPAEACDGFFWMGPQGTITPFHHDLANNLMVQIAGRKRVKLVAAAETPRMRNSRHCFSDWQGDDLAAGPGDAERPPVLEVILEPGDALFLPIGWWHHAEGLAPTIGMSFINFACDNDFYSHYVSFGPL